MILSWHGLSCVSLKNRAINIVCDPYDESAGLKLPELKADIVTFSRSDENTPKSTPEIKVFSWPGEYEAQGVYFEGIFSDEKDGQAVVFKFKANGVDICHLGMIKEIPGENVISKIGKVDILLVPVGGGKVMNAKDAKKIIEDTEPAVVVPIYYATPGVKEKLASLEEALKELQVKDYQKVDKLDLKKLTLSEGKMEIVVLEPELA